MGGVVVRRMFYAILGVKYGWYFRFFMFDRPFRPMLITPILVNRLGPMEKSPRGATVKFKYYDEIAELYNPEDLRK